AFLLTVPLGILARPGFVLLPALFVLFGLRSARGLFLLLLALGVLAPPRFFLLLALFFLLPGKARSFFLLSLREPRGFFLLRLRAAGRVFLLLLALRLLTLPFVVLLGEARVFHTLPLALPFDCCLGLRLA